MSTFSCKRRADGERAYVGPWNQLGDSRLVGDFPCVCHLKGQDEPMIESEEPEILERLV
jgi:hypothetical protein